VRANAVPALPPTLAALLGLLAITASAGAAGGVGSGKMTVSPTRTTAASTGNELTFTFLADAAAFTGQTIVDFPPGWSAPQRTNRSAPGYVEVQPRECRSATRITAIVGRRISIATSCRRQRSYRLLYHQATAPRFSADGYVFLTQTRPARRGKRIRFRPLDSHKQPVVRVRGGPASALFMTVTSVASSGGAFTATVRAIDPYENNAGGFTGTVTLTSTDPAATLPAPYTYGPSDTAQHAFTGLILRTPGTQRITATDSTGLSVQSAPITVVPAGS
jgi:hypothetical protein